MFHLLRSFPKSPASPEDESVLDVVFDRAGEDPAEATCQRQQRVWALLAERWAKPEEVEDLKRMKDRPILFPNMCLYVFGDVLKMGVHGLKLNACISMHFQRIHQKKDHSQVWIPK